MKEITNMCGAGIWRRLAVASDTNLEELALAILHAFKLDNDHLYDFRYRDQRGKKRQYNHPLHQLASCMSSPLVETHPLRKVASRRMIRYKERGMRLNFAELERFYQDLVTRGSMPADIRWLR